MRCVELAKLQLHRYKETYVTLQKAAKGYKKVNSFENKMFRIGGGETGSTESCNLPISDTQMHFDVMIKPFTLEYLGLCMREDMVHDNKMDFSLWLLYFLRHCFSCIIGILLIMEC